MKLYSAILLLSWCLSCIPLSYADAPSDELPRIDLELSKALTGDELELNWQAQSGRVYFILFSETLEPDSWAYFSTVVVGSDAEEIFSVSSAPPSSDALGKCFYRVVSQVDLGGDGLEQDNDNDMLTNAEEFALATDPLAIDIDADNDDMHFLAEYLIKRDPAVADSVQDSSSRKLDIFNYSSF